MPEYRPSTAPRRAALRAAFAAVLTGVAGTASAEVVLGRLELQWGDPAPAVRAAPVLEATLLTDGGRRIALPAAQALRVAGDLHALAGRRVAVEFGQAKAAGDARPVEAIVPADRLELREPDLSNTGPLMKAAAIAGTTRWVTLMCKFADIATEQKGQGFFQAQYGDAPGELGHYWREVSYGKIDLAGSQAYGWFTLPNPRAYYFSQVDGKEKADLGKLYADCTAAADAQVNFVGVQGINQMFNGDLDGFAWGGGRCGTLDGQNQCRSTTWNPPWAFNNLAPLAHEMGHGYGLPHSDNSDGDSDTYDNVWDVMSDAWNNAPSSPTYGRLPKHICVFQRDRLGWIDAARKRTIAAAPTRVTVDLDFVSSATSANTRMVVLTLPDQGGDFTGVTYTLEARRRTGTYEPSLAGDAVVIHALRNGGNAKSQDADVPPANRSNNEGSMFKVGETWVSPDPQRTFWVTVEAQTATGFRVSVGPKPRIMSGRLPPSLAAQPVAAPAPSTPASDTSGSGRATPRGVRDTLRRIAQDPDRARR